MSERKAYKVQVTIIEGVELKGKDGSGTSDPYIKITCGNLEPQVSVSRGKTNMAMWNQAFTFDNLMMNPEEIESWELLLEAYDRNSILLDELIGACSIGLGTMYRSNREFYRQWLPLFSAEDPTRPQGYLRVSCYINGPGEDAPVHGEGEKGYGDLEFNQDDIEGGLNVEQKKQKNLEGKGIYVVGKPLLMSKAYQLTINIYKGDWFIEPMSTFVAVRCGGVVLKTLVVKKSDTPNYQYSLQFPVYTPIKNDNVTIKVWQDCTLAANVFIAQVGEEWGRESPFNLSNLLQAGDKVITRWYNLYGVSENSRGKLGPPTRIGKEFIGRILMNATMQETDSPVLGATRSPVGNEPKPTEFIVIVDVVKLQKGFHLKKTIRIGVACGNRAEEFSVPAVESSEPGIYLWSSKNSHIPTIKGFFPISPLQCPDVFLYLYEENNGVFSKSWDVIGFARVKASDCYKEQPDVKWVSFNSIKGESTDSPGELLCNVQFLPYTESLRRMPLEEEKTNYFINIKIHSGFFVHPDEDNDADVNSFVTAEGPDINVKTDVKPGRYPIWDFTFSKPKIILHKQLERDGDLVLTLKTLKKKLFGGTSEVELGRIALKLANLSAAVKKVEASELNPDTYMEYFNFNSDSKVKGRVLAFIILREIKEESADTLGPSENTNINKGVPSMLREGNLPKMSFGCRLKISAIGLRNMKSIPSKPMLKFSLTSFESEEEKLLLKPSPLRTKGGLDSKINFNFLEKAQDKDVELNEFPIYWPYLKIELVDEDKPMKVAASTTLLLYPFSQHEKITENLIESAINLFNWNCKNSKVQQYAAQTSKSSSKTSSLGVRTVKSGFGSHINRSRQKSGLKGGSLISEVEEEDMESVSEGVELKFQKSLGNLKAEKQQSIADGEGPKDIKEQEEEEKRIQEEEIPGISGPKQLPEKDLMHFGDEEMKVRCLKGEKDNIKARAKKLLMELEGLKNKFQNSLDKSTDKTRKGMLLKEFATKMAKLKGINDEVDADVFCGYNNDLQGELEADVQKREIVRGDYDKELKMPYTRIKLYDTNTFGYRDSKLENPFAKKDPKPIGELKVCIKVVDKNEDSKDLFTRWKEEKAKKENEEEKVKEIKDEFEEMNEALQEFPFDICLTEFLDVFTDTQMAYRANIYVIGCKNLTAVDSHADLMALSAGYSANCAANPYLQITVGDGKNQENFIKKIVDKESVVKGSLNPKFLQTYIMDFKLPEDLNLLIQIYSNNTIKLDDLIGETTIDLEDRFFCDAYNQEKIALKVYKAIYKRYKEDTMKIQRSDNEERREMCDEKEKHAGKYQGALSTMEIRRKMEIRQLLHEKRPQSQGTIQLWIDPYKAADTYKKYPLKLSSSSKYELRVVIWETNNVPKRDNKIVNDIFVACTLEMNDYKSDPIRKETDTHMGSKNGWGEFNWRMKFRFDLSGEPRLKIQVYDFGTFGNEVMGEKCIFVKPLVARAIKDEKNREDPRVRLDMIHPNYPGKLRGEVDVQLYIYKEEEADAKPVGEGQDEPNENPHLEKPTEGRGLGAYLTGSFLDPNSWHLPNFGLFFIIKTLLFIGTGLIGMAGIVIMAKFI